MCNLEKYLKVNLAKQIVVNDRGAVLDMDKLILQNFAENCKPHGSAKEAVVSVFVSKNSGDSSMANTDVELTKKLYKVLNYMVEEKQERYLGNLFVGKVRTSLKQFSLLVMPV